MSIDLDSTPLGAPELTELGKRIEMLRIERGLSKQHLARDVGASRQQLWRVMTGKSELTSSLRHRLADALRVDPSTLSRAPAGASWVQAAPSVPTGTAPVSELPPPTRSLASFASAREPSPGPLSEFLDDLAHVENALGVLPSGDDGRRLKRALLTALEDLAVERGVTLDARFFDLRRRVVNHEL